ncbi:longitudinals lacking protein, isoforms H/M/V isoform X15 [Nasonia vitripennis]|uniref:BTB domain-containing protein n=1 Tax=Nasonia vitripennis TaxID=7425 RepID=A0A7M7QJ57_NASVI|nr:longitudinals lacking protein, isoforms H/M/V isoform X15 [Nasonia vitripennis]XP_032456427.1 longitudinals lacking protein, isoforms H/M/V isoform X15 [Nasonia vitripennis]
MEDDQQFCLRWNNHQSTIIQNFDTLLESGTLVDCTLAAEGKYLKAHKVVLSACSPYFEGLLSEHYDKHPVFILKDVKFKELKAMMDYMYRGEVNISQDQLTALLKAAESLQIKGLSDSRTDKGTGNTGNTTTGGSKDNTRPAKTASSTAAASASAAAVDIPHTSSGLTIEKNSKVPRQSIQQVSVSDQLENSASPQLRGHSSREGSQSPTRKRKRLRRRSLGNDDNSMENHEASNSSDVNMTAPALGVAPVAEEKSQADPADSIGRSALMQQLTKPADEMLQMPLEKPEPSEDMIQPKSEYQDDQESVEDLTNFDDDMNDLNEMEQDNSRAGPSHDPSQHAGMPSWHIAGDRSNASVVGAAAGPGAGDEVFLAAAEAAQAQRDSQDVDIVWIKDEEKIKKTIKKEFSDNEEQGRIATAKKKPVVNKNKFQVVTVKQEFVDDRTESGNTIFVRPDLVAEKCILPDLRTDTHANTIEDEETDEEDDDHILSAELIKKLRAKPQSPRLVAAVKEEIKIAQRTPEKIAYKIVTPATPHPIDTFEGWCMRNVSKHEYKPPVIPGVTHHRTIVRPTTSRPNLKREAPYRMTANLRMALEAVDKGANYADTAAIYGFTAERLMHIKKLEKENPDYIFYRDFLQTKKKR